MTLRLLFSVLVFSLVTPSASAQEKRALDHSDYARWSSISDAELSSNGKWAVWRQAPDTEGDGMVLVSRTDGDHHFVIPRGDNPVFAGGFVVALVHAAYDSTRQAKVDGAKGEDLPKDSLAVLNLDDGSVAMFGPVKSFRVPEDGAGVVAILFDEVTETSRDTTTVEAPHDKKDGNRLTLLTADSGETHTFDSVLDYRLTSDGEWMVYAAESKDGGADGVYAVATDSGIATALAAGEGYYRQLTLADEGHRAAFVSNAPDFESDAPDFDLHVGTPGEAARAVSLTSAIGLPEGWAASEHGRLNFSDSGERLYFGTATAPEPAPEDPRPDDEKVAVDVWSWTDADLMTVQLVNRDRDRKQSYPAVYHLGSGHVVQLGDEAIPSIDDVDHGDAPVVFGSTNLPYKPGGSWDTPGWRDVYAIDVQTGTRTLVAQGIRSRPTPSPDGSHIAWWDGEELVWKIGSWSNNPQSTVVVSIPPPDGVRFENELHDSPAIPGSNGSVGWTSDGQWFLFYDRYDLWAAQPRGRTWNVTSGQGREQGLRYRTIRLDPDANTVDLSTPLLLSTFNTVDRSAGFAEAVVEGSRSTITQLITGDKRFGTPAKASDSGELMLTRQSYREFPDLWITNGRFADWARLSSANPQQSKYLWGTAGLVHWTSVDGEELAGILYKPEGFDPSKEYPMMVYFYERATDGLHSYHTPAPGRSVINRSFYTSRGYLVFVPDIPYKVGYPGESAMNAVMPGVTSLIDQGFVDRKRVGVQGHSWGGYQIAYMVTRTNLFAAAEAGAPVSNMFSAYGGIRWQTGLSRMFQYERTQSRIGGTIWEKPLRYIENSPLFWLDKVETPLLIMHNDNDGHVPWYQGIELFVGLRRLGKPTWLLNYNGEPHWPLPYWSRMDFTVRMQQFFDHYLMDAPAPVWLKEGLPAVRKGEDWGLDTRQPTDTGDRH
ncbi:MAG: dipeptidyl aminopeptidase/acylaminoacyl peptidase [Rhodothermales bacterium]|jgi:dipeptidyl aminopeptidase/acylaminoacyl peptidase